MRTGIEVKIEGIGPVLEKEISGFGVMDDLVCRRGGRVGGHRRHTRIVYEKRRRKIGRNVSDQGHFGHFEEEGGGSNHAGDFSLKIFIKLGVSDVVGCLEGLQITAGEQQLIMGGAFAEKG
jgi:hypothetical protein